MSIDLIVAGAIEGTVKTMCTVMLIAVVGTVFVLEGVPWLWQVIKPWLHHVTG